MLTGRAVRYIFWIEVNINCIYYSYDDGPARSRSQCPALVIDRRADAVAVAVAVYARPRNATQRYATPRKTTSPFAMLTPPTHAVPSRRDVCSI